ncbi:MAG: tRNA (N6-threonylcarbamoyladenosine(37)-N6)-methyltransferase TrmO [Clostridiales bacterium]|nr:tRNA (N6-threonylcarbamoyladenosine(37)-N6)-methyltransferase TrmO [Clostridiales bacterium]MCF8023349.1 tRNA (N6-threonylcarbamoyladenosine(37)-N6)-methyltransferase TrmO [Clostridiales bacterium]
MSDTFTVKPIGYVRSPYKNKSDAPRQGKFEQKTSFIDIDPAYVDGLLNVDKASHLIVLYWGHQSNRKELQTTTPWGPDLRGVFACRTPNRPNPISLCVVELEKREGSCLVVNNLDAIEGSPVLDIKPYSKKVDSIPHAELSWFDEKN